MEYYEAVNRLEGLRRLRPKLGTETTASLLASHGNPHETLTAVQVAGSNGKGSTASFLASILREHGLRVGLYTSPDLNDLRERIRVQGQKIPKREVSRFVESTWPEIVDSAVEDDSPTFFEVFTAMAFWHFERANVDVAVLEVGIGGRYDATSVVDPVAAAVTNVSLEHTDILGSTVQEIARDKAQVAPTDAPLVTGTSGEALDTIRGITDVVTVGATSDVPDEGGTDTSRQETTADPETTDVQATETGMLSTTEASLSLTASDWSVRTRTPLLGRHQALNAGIAATLAHQITDPTEEEIAAGIRNVYWPGRFEVMDKRPLVVLDGAHNPAACARLSGLLDRFEYDQLTLVFGAMRDKDHVEMVRSLPSVDQVLLAEPDVSRAADGDLLASVVDRETGTTPTQEGSVLAALESALSSAGPDDCVLVAGSLYTVAEARDRFTRTVTPIRTDRLPRARDRLEQANIPPTRRRRDADRLVHSTVRLRVRRGEAATVKELMLSFGGYCGVSGIESADEHVDIVVAGTLDQFQRLIDALPEEGDEYDHLGAQLARGLASRGTVFDGDAVQTDSAGFRADDRPHDSGTGTNSGTYLWDDTSSEQYPWDDTPSVMGILNVTPDSFHDGGEYQLTENAVSHAKHMIEAGADIVDVGGESTRPGADPVSPETERDRVVPVIEALSDLDVLVSVDTRKPAVARAALEAGADIVNDVTGLADVEMRHLVAEWDVPVVIMHSLSAPVDPDRDYAYDDVVSDVLDTLTERLLLAERAGIDRSRIVIDPGLGFGKSADESFELLDRLEEFTSFGFPVLVGHSHKSMFGGLPHGEDRLAHTLAASALAVDRGADIVRVHDVPENVAAVATAVRTAGDEHATDD